MSDPRTMTDRELSDAWDRLHSMDEDGELEAEIIFRFRRYVEDGRVLPEHSWVEPPPCPCAARLDRLERAMRYGGWWPTPGDLAGSILAALGDQQANK